MIMGIAYKWKDLTTVTSTLSAADIVNGDIYLLFHQETNKSMLANLLIKVKPGKNGSGL